MLYPNLAIALGLCCCLAGCATRQQNRAHAPDWESEDAASVQEGPRASPQPAPSLPVKTPTPAGPAPVVQRFGETWVPLNRWSRANALPAPVCQALTPLPTYAINTTNGTLVLKAGTRTAHWDGLDVRLGFAPQLVDGQPFVHFLDLNKTIQPLLTGYGAGPLSRVRTGAAPVIVIDPGHGGENAGTRSAVGPHFEKDFTLDWARRLQVRLQAQGWRAFLTRTNDSDVPISNRVAFAQELAADLFVSLHFNSSAPNDGQVGLETYCVTPTGMPSTVRRQFEDDSAEILPNNAFDIENLRLALCVHRALLQINGHRDRGVRRARFPGVLRGQQRPAVLIEGGYLSNPEEARRIAEPQYRQKLAEAVAQALGAAN